ncbi:MAG: chorismate-binding protein, partial [Candidatus Margulisiibacteriota bacterium]
DESELTQQSRTFLDDSKSQKEHAYVMNCLLHGFKHLCSQVSEPSRVTTMPQNGLLHLHSSLRGRLRPTVCDEQILNSLHPTPAVGGYPKEVTRKVLARLEPFKRGWYAGTIGRISLETTELAVGIRSMLARKKSIYIYAGAGIISQSDAEMEWRELCQKTQPFRSRWNA